MRMNTYMIHSSGSDMNFGSSELLAQLVFAQAGYSQRQNDLSCPQEVLFLWRIVLAYIC